MDNNITNLLEEPTGNGEAFPILDSRLITATSLKKYNVKVVECGEYTQVYLYENTKFLKKKKDNTDLELKKQILKIFDDNKKDEGIGENAEKQIEERNIVRSKLTCQRIAKANSTIWETFITLTIADNVQDLKKANKMFHSFTTKIRRIKKDFAYIAIPEFQKRGAIHYHLLTNISIDDGRLIYSESAQPNHLHVKYWNEGFTKVDKMKGDIKKIVGYISKYMTKDIDNRLFGHRRFFYSQNLSMPKENYIDTDVKLDKDFYKKRTQDKQLIYQSEYINPFDNSKVTFLEFTSFTT